MDSRFVSLSMGAAMLEFGLGAVAADVREVVLSGTRVLGPGDGHPMSGLHITARPETALTGDRHATVTFRPAPSGPR